MLTINEKKLIAHTLNGCGMLLESQSHYLDLMAGRPGDPPAPRATISGGGAVPYRLEGMLSCGLEHEVLDAINLNALDTKWQVNGAELLWKIRGMAPEDRRRLITTIAGIWARNDAHFERDLDACPV